MTHRMKLRNSPYQKIREGKKTIEIRLCDEKRQKVKIGDRIEFTNLDDPSRKLITEVKALHRFSGFGEMFRVLPGTAMGFEEGETPDPNIMEDYYSAEEQAKYGALGIELILLDAGKDDKPRCKWCNPKNPKYIAYHDEEWGVPNFEEQYLYEMLILESFQAGLSWECVLNKREAFREAFDGFDIYKVMSYDEAKQKELAENKGIIRNKRKIAESIKNSKIFLAISREYGSFYAYLRTFTKDQTYYEIGKTTNDLSDSLSKDLQKRGMTFVGSVIIYSYLQAIGVIRSHDRDCFLYQGENP